MMSVIAKASLTIIQIRIIGLKDWNSDQSKIFQIDAHKISYKRDNSVMPS